MLPRSKLVRLSFNGKSFDEDKILRIKSLLTLEKFDEVILCWRLGNEIDAILER